jgi:deazaflavin-dependent oxidoreductase (nitroreductase family)
MTTDMNEWNRRVIDEFRANGGKVGGDFESLQLLLLHHTGAKSGQERVNPLAYQRLDDSSVAVFASKGGAPTNPDWFHNLVAHPDVSVEIGSETHPATARVAAAEERERIWNAQKIAYPNFAEYEKTAAGRKIPVVVLDLA